MLIALLALCQVASAAGPLPPTVLATIKPLHSIASAVTEGISEPELLLDGTISPHLFQVKPSHIRLVEDADVVVWAGEGVERFLPSMINNLNDDAVMVAMAEHSTALHTVRDKHSEHDADNGEIDNHFWLDPQNVIALAEVLAVELGSIDPQNADRYKSNAEVIVRQLGSTSAAIKTQLTKSEGQQYFIYHDSLQYLEKAFGLGDAIIVAPQPQVQAGGKRLRTLRDQLDSQQVGCLISEPQFRSPVVSSIAEDIGIEPALIDPLAADFEAGADLYSNWLHDLATKLADCFAAHGAKQ